MLHRLGQGLLTDRLTQADGRSATGTTGAVGFGKGSLTSPAAKTAFEHDQSDLVLAHAQISLHARSAIMDLVARVLAVWACCCLASGSHHEAHASILMPFLAHQVEFRQIQGDHDSFLAGCRFNGFFGMLSGQVLLLLSLESDVFSSSTNHKPLRLLSGLFLLWILSSITLKDGEPACKGESVSG